MNPSIASILVVDDVPDNLQVLSDILTREGYLVRPVTSAAMAFRTMEAALPQLVLADIKMPEMNGYEFCQRLKEDERTREIPVIFISALGETQDKVRAFEVGGVDYITKPFQAGEIVARVRTHLALSELRLSLVQLNTQLEDRVRFRTQELAANLEALSREVAERRRAEDELQRLNEELEGRVRERTAQLEASNIELEAFSYSVSHDLRAPLRGIEGFSQALLEDCQDQLDETGREYLARIRAGTERMGGIIEALLKLSRVGRSDLGRMDVDLSALCRRILEGLACADPGRQIDCVIQPGLRAQADPHLLAMALENLLSNAWKFTARTEAPRIEVGAGVQGAFYIRDNGAGFEMAFAPKLFKAFQRLHSAQEFEGTGIGLAIVQRIIRRHGGRIWAQAEPQRGATFFFTLPA